MIMNQKLKCYVCEEDECNSTRNQTLDICHNAVMCWTATVREDDGTKRYSRGCILSRDQMPFYCRQKRPVNLDSNGPLFLTQCCKTNLCNAESFTILPDRKTSIFEMSHERIKLLTITISILSLLFLFGLAVFCMKRKLRKINPIETSADENDVESGIKSTTNAPTAASVSSFLNELNVTSVSDSIIKEILGVQTFTSGTGGGNPRLARQTLAKQVSLVKCLTSNTTGHFGCAVWRGIRLGESVAVKIYTLHDEVLWARETEIYTQLLPSRHENILGYLGSDIISRAGTTELWVVNNYYPQGSLYRYLKRLSEPLNHQQMLSMCLSISNGLLYLHTEVNGTQGKPTMAHLNLKSKNILVKGDGTCIIADLAFVITKNKLDKMDPKRGAKRYMSPELLENTYDPQCMEGFRCADMYSLALVFWELCRKCISNGVALDYEAPYAEWLETDNKEPTLEDMRKLVVDEKRRPTIPNQWNSDPTMAAMGIIMKECWRMKPTARLPILRVKKTLIKLATNDPTVNLVLD